MADACPLLQLGTVKAGASKKNPEKDRKKSQTADVLKAKNGKHQQVEQTLPPFSPQMQKTSGISCFESHERMDEELIKKSAF